MLTKDFFKKRSIKNNSRQFNPPIHILKYKPFILCSTLIFLFVYLFFNPILTTDNIVNSETILNYQYWKYSSELDYNEEYSLNFAKTEINKNSNSQVLILFNELDKKQNITITKNKQTGKIYFFINDGGYKSYLKTYISNGTELELEEKIWIMHPYKVGYGKYDEETNQLYLGVIRTNFTEADFWGKWINGCSKINIDFWRKINNLIGKEF